jgi:hypothetical protein
MSIRATRYLAGQVMAAGISGGVSVVSVFATSVGAGLGAGSGPLSSPEQAAITRASTPHSSSFSIILFFTLLVF